MSKTRVKLSEQVKQAVEESGITRYAICKAIGMHESVMSRFMNGKGGLQQDSLDALADVLRLDIVAGKPIELPAPQKAGRKPKAEAR
jgi:transcriptional regulator with XRE-family HTH domain